MALTAAAFAPAASAQSGFDTAFADSTLRLDYILSGTANGSSIALAGQSKSPVWAGRRVNLGSLPYTGNGQVTVTDAATGDTLYRNSFSTLYQEWLSTPEATTTPTAMEHTVLVPLPRRRANVSVNLLDNRHREIAAVTTLYRPDDELVAVRPAHSPFANRVIHQGGPTDKAIDVVILAEGYTPAEMDSFFTHAATAVEAILSHEPFKSRSADFNFTAVATPSAQSGVSVPRKGDWRSTAFSSHFSTFYSDRYLTTADVHRIHDALDGIPYEHIIILANTPEYGGGGIYNSYTLTAARHSAFRPVVVHEFGHSFGGLADEYFYPGDVMEDTYPADIEPWEPNITTLVDFPSKWSRLLPSGTPVPTPVAEAAKYPLGVFEGGGYSAKGVYRPADQCRMRTNSWPAFCAACTDAISRLIDFYTR